MFGKVVYANLSIKYLLIFAGAFTLLARSERCEKKKERGQQQQLMCGERWAGRSNLLHDHRDHDGVPVLRLIDTTYEVA